MNYKISLINEAKDLCQKAGLNFKKFLEGNYVYEDKNKIMDIGEERN